MVDLLNYIPFQGMTYVDMQLVEKNLEREAYCKKFTLREIPPDAVKNLLSSDVHFYTCHSFYIEENKTLPFPRTRVSYFYTIEDVVEYIKPAPKEGVLNSILNSLIPVDNFLKEEIVFLKYMSYLRKYITTYHDIIIKRNSSIKFQPLRVTTANMERKYSKRYIDGPPSLVEIELRKISGLRFEEIKNVTIDPLLKGMEVFKKGETSIRDGYLALLWIRSAILRAGKIHIYPRDLLFCKTIQLLYALWDVYKEDNLIEELQKLHQALHEQNSNFSNLHNQNMVKSTYSNHSNSTNPNSTIGTTIDSIDSTKNNKNNNIKNLKKIEKIIETFTETTMMHFELMKKLPLSYKPFYGGRDSYSFLLLSFIWDICSNVLKIKDFENVPPLKVEILETILESDIWQTETFIRKLESYRKRGRKDISHKLTVIEKEILPSLCEAICKFIHSPKIFYNFLDNKEIVFYEPEINENRKNKQDK